MIVPIKFLEQLTPIVVEGEWGAVQDKHTEKKIVTAYGVVAGILIVVVFVLIVSENSPAIRFIKKLATQ